LPDAGLGGEVINDLDSFEKTCQVGISNVCLDELESPAIHKTLDVRALKRGLVVGSKAVYAGDLRAGSDEPLDQM
jgi:hypothetical protein